eukprot:scaffold19441_cov193-Skeletonema_dohrnii-CCMP3373.AAC.2
MASATVLSTPRIFNRADFFYVGAVGTNQAAARSVGGNWQPQQGSRKATPSPPPFDHMAIITRY